MDTTLLQVKKESKGMLLCYVLIYVVKSFPLYTIEMRYQYKLTIKSCLKLAHAVALMQGSLTCGSSPSYCFSLLSWICLSHQLLFPQALCVHGIPEAGERLINDSLKEHCSSGDSTVHHMYCTMFCEVRVLESSFLFHLDL